MVSSSNVISSTAQSTLQTITNATAYASPANLVLANFDYALNSVSLHLSRYNLDVQATKVLTTLVRLAGSDVVERAGDVVEECFDRLDEYHGYGIIVEGLVGVLGEVVRVLRSDDEAKNSNELDPADPKGVMARHAEALDSKGAQRFEEFMNWFGHRNDPDPLYAVGDEPVGPVPQRAWGKDEANDEGEDEDNLKSNSQPSVAPPSKMQGLTEQIVARSLFFLTHPSPLIPDTLVHVLAHVDDQGLDEVCSFGDHKWFRIT